MEAVLQPSTAATTSRRLLIACPFIFCTCGEEQAPLLWLLCCLPYLLLCQMFPAKHSPESAQAAAGTTPAAGPACTLTTSSKPMLTSAASTWPTTTICCVLRSALD